MNSNLFVGGFVRICAFENPGERVLLVHALSTWLLCTKLQWRENERHASSYRSGVRGSLNAAIMARPLSLWKLAGSRSWRQWNTTFRRRDCHGEIVPPPPPLPPIILERAPAIQGGGGRSRRVSDQQPANLASGNLKALRLPAHPDDQLFESFALVFAFWERRVL